MNIDLANLRRTGADGGHVRGSETPPRATDPAIVEMVREQLRRDPPPPLAALYGRALRIDPAIRKLSLRQFNALYPLQVRRRLKREAERAAKRAQRTTPPADVRGQRTTPADDARGRRTTPADDARGRPTSAGTDERARRTRTPGRGEAELRRRVRAILLDWARLVSGSRSKVEVVEAVGQVDDYVHAIYRLLASRTSAP